MTWLAEASQASGRPVDDAADASLYNVTMLYRSIAADVRSWPRSRRMVEAASAEDMVTRAFERHWDWFPQSVWSAADHAVARIVVYQDIRWQLSKLRERFRRREQLTGEGLEPVDLVAESLDPFEAVVLHQHLQRLRQEVADDPPVLALLEAICPRRANGDLSLGCLVDLKNREDLMARLGLPDVASVTNVKRRLAAAAQRILKNS